MIDVGVLLQRVEAAAPIEAVEAVGLGLAEMVGARAVTLLVADDPTMGVDVLVRGRILTVIADLQRERAFSALVIGHDIREMRTMTEQIAIMQGGMIVGLGQVDDVLENPLHPYVERLAESISLAGPGARHRMPGRVAS